MSNLPEEVQSFIRLLHAFADGDVKDNLNKILVFLFKENEDKKPKESFVDFLTYLLRNVEDFSTQALMTSLQKYATDNKIESSSLLREFYYVGMEVTKFISKNFQPPLCKKVTRINLASFLELIHKRTNQIN